MAIQKGLEQGDVLWKGWADDPVMSRRHKHYWVQLTSRRARTRGTFVPNNAVAVMEFLKLHMQDQMYYGYGGREERKYVIGVHTFWIPEHEYEGIQICDQAKEYISRMRNESFRSILRLERVSNDHLTLEKAKNIVVPEEEDSWMKEEEVFNGYHLRQMEQEQREINLLMEATY